MFNVRCSTFNVHGARRPDHLGRVRSAVRTLRAARDRSAPPAIRRSAFDVRRSAFGVRRCLLDTATTGPPLPKLQTPNSKLSPPTPAFPPPPLAITVPRLMEVAANATRTTK